MLYLLNQSRAPIIPAQVFPMMLEEFRVPPVWTRARINISGEDSSFNFWFSNNGFQHGYPLFINQAPAINMRVITLSFWIQCITKSSHLRCWGLFITKASFLRSLLCSTKANFLSVLM